MQLHGGLLTELFTRLADFHGVAQLLPEAPEKLCACLQIKPTRRSMPLLLES